MPKTKTKTVWAQKARRKLQNGTTGSKNAEQVYQKEDITPIVRQLDSTSETERASASQSIAFLLANESARKLLLRERVILQLIQLGAHGVSIEALAAYYGALRAVALYEGYDAVLYMFRQDILSPLQKLLLCLLQSDSPAMPTKQLTGIQSLLLENILYVLKALSETNEKVISAIRRAQILPLSLNMVGSGCMTEDVEIANLQFLYSFTEDNSVDCTILANSKAHWDTLCNIVKRPRTPLVQILAAGALHNVLECSVLEFEVLPERLSKINTFIIQHISSGLNESSLGLDGQSILLEVVASVASTIAMQYMSEDDISDPGDDENMDLVFDEEKRSTRVEGKSLGPMLRDAMIKVQEKFSMQGDLGLQLRIVDCLNNILWTLHALKLTQYVSKAELWEWCYNVMDVCKIKELACHFSSLMLGIAVLKPHIQFTAKQFELLVAMHDKIDAESQGKIVALLGNVGQSCALELNEKIGQFLMFHISKIPKTANSPAIEAIDAVIDLYADETQESNTNFVMNSFLTLLENTIPKALQMAKSIDKRKTPDLRERADEACTNLVNFCKYKRTL